jgi:single-strand DNA-binding protein
LQTREYTDRDGNQRKTTEVVLQRFRGELTLLDSRGRGDFSEDRSSSFEASSGSSFGRSSPMDRSSDRSMDTQEKRPATVGGGRMSDVIDDDIPF